MVKNLESLKERGLSYSVNPRTKEEWIYLYYCAIAEMPPVHAHNLRRAYVEKYVLDHYSVQIGPDDLLAGTVSPCYELSDEERALVEKGQEIERLAGAIGGYQTGGTEHRVIDYEKLLRLGIEGILLEIDEKLSRLSYADADYCEKQAFYQSCKISLQAVCDFAKRYSIALREKSVSESDGARSASLMKMSEILEQVPLRPARNFYEAMQSMWFVQYCLRIVNDITLTGRLDNYLYPYYEKDLRKGLITKDFAYELICQLFVKHNEIYETWPASVMVGGVDRQGHPVWNDLTNMCIDAIGDVGLINPSVAVCYTDDMPEELLDKCVDMVAKGYTRPSIFNDRIVQQGLREAGVREEDARYYVHSTCVEITPIGCSNISVATPYININKAFEYIFGNKKQLYGDGCAIEGLDFELSSLKTFEDFYDLAKQAVSEIIKNNLEWVSQQLFSTAKYKSCPMSSAFLGDCLESGKDSAAGGARYNFVYPCFPGFVNFVDSLSAIKKAVYDEKIVTLEEMAAALADNFAKEEDIRQYLCNRCPKFGNGEDDADAFGVEMYEFLKEELKKYRVQTGGTFHSSYFAWIMHGRLGACAAASPDGRRQGEALSECLGSVQGMDKNGPAGVLRSIRKLDQKSGIGGIATNFRFAKNFIASKKGHDAVKNFIRTFFKSGCFEIQFNVVDQKDLIAARENPEKYRTLMVRVAGYSDYFVNLDPVIQDEIIRRSEHGNI